jgi:hypothetical protein
MWISPTILSVISVDQSWRQVHFRCYILHTLDNYYSIIIGQKEDRKSRANLTAINTHASIPQKLIVQVPKVRNSQTVSERDVVLM